jgi:hypothetical protein
MNVIMIGPGYPDEMPFFTRGLAREGAAVIGVGDQPEHDVPQMTKRHLAAYLRVPSLQDEDGVVRTVVD